MKRLATIVLLALVGCAGPKTPGPAAPTYLPSAFSDAAVDITTNAYGAYAGAPDALEIGDLAPDFALPSATGEVVSLGALRAGGDVVLVFFRGFW